MNKLIKFTVDFMDNSYFFDYGSDVYIFHTGIYNEMYVKYGICELLRYVDLVNACYLKDSNRTPLGAFADYVAENWNKVKHLDRYELLNKFYEQDGGF